MWSLILLASVLYVVWFYMYPKSAAVPLQPGHHPILGYALKMIRAKDMWKFVQDAGKFSVENGGVTKILLPFCCTLYHITEVTAACTVLSQCLDKMFCYKAVEQIFGSILIAAPVTTWKTTRRILDNAFKVNVLNGYLELFNEQAAKLAHRLEAEVGKGEVNLKDAIGLNILETSWQTTVERNLDKEETGGAENLDKNVLDCFHKQNKIWIKRCKTFYLIPNITFNLSKLKREQDIYMKVINSKIQSAIEKSKAQFYERRRNNIDNQYEESKFFSSLDIILENSHTDHGFLYSDSDLKQFMANVLLATFDTTSLTLLYALVCIGSDCDVQEKIYQEIKTVVGDSDVRKEHLSKLEYLQAVIKEVARLYPAGPVVGRQSANEVQLKNVTIPKGGCFVVHLWAINRRKEYWGEDAELFRPERWLEPKTLPHPATAFASFSLGQRNCIGKTYLLNEIKVYLVHILRRYRVSGDRTKLKFDFDPLLKSIAGDLISLQYR